MTFNRRVVGLTPALAATQGPWASPLPAVACALRRETPIQYACCSRERLWVVEDLKGRYRNGRMNEWILLARKLWGTGIILWSRAAVSTLERSHLVFIDPGVKIIGASCYCDVLLAQHLLPVIRNLALEDYSIFQQDIEMLKRDTIDFIPPTLWPPIWVLLIIKSGAWCKSKFTTYQSII